MCPVFGENPRQHELREHWGRDCRLFKDQALQQFNLVGYFLVLV